MNVFLAGATGAVGRPLVAQLLAAGHEVVAMTRSDDRAAQLTDAGASAVVCDVFDRERLLRAVEAARPDVVVHQLTAIPEELDPRKIKTELAETNRLRSEGTRNLIEAATAAGARRFVAQSIAFAYRPDGHSPKTEADPLYEDAPSSYVDVVRAIASLEQQTTGAADLEGVVLRYGFFYGPGTVYAADGSFAEGVRRRDVPLIGKGTGVFSFIHVDDAASAAVKALTEGQPGIYNVVDDEPAAAAEWLPVYAELLGAPRPHHVPKTLARIVAGAYAIYLMCEQRGASSAKAREALRWTPRFPTWRTGFREMLA